MPADNEKGDRPETADARARTVEWIISTLLRTGVLTSLAIVVIGLVLSFVHHPQYTRSHEELERLTRPGAPFPHTLAQVWSGLRQLQGQSVVAAGLLLLIATPVMRVAVSILVFVYENDRIFILITCVVLALLLLSFLLGRTTG